MSTERSADVFGEALLAYSQGDRSPFCLADSSGKLHKIELSRYFRTDNQFTRLERKLISLASGEILDVGCGTGNYLPLLADRGPVLGIDISPAAIKVAHMTGSKCCAVADIFTFSTAKKYDTITFLGNGLGIGGSISGTERLLDKLSTLLKNDGQVLAIGRTVTKARFVVTRLRPIWGLKVGPQFGWIHISRALLSGLCDRAGLCLSVVQGNQHYLLYRIRKSRPKRR